MEMVFPSSFLILFSFTAEYKGNSCQSRFLPRYCLLYHKQSVSVISCSFWSPLSLTEVTKFHFIFFFSFSVLSSGSQQHPGAEGCERHILQPAVSSAVPLQLPQVTAQDTAELPASRLGNENSPQWTAFLHRPQQQNHHMGEETHCDNRLDWTTKWCFLKYKWRETSYFTSLQFSSKLPGKNCVIWL